MEDKPARQVGNSQQGLDALAPEMQDPASESFASLFRAARPEPAPELVFPLQFGHQGSLVGGRLRVLRRLGGGGMGTVYEALDDGRPVALKTLNRLQVTQIYRLKTEFRRLAELTHDNVVSVRELFSEQDHWFFTMDLVRGRSLNEGVLGRSFGAGDSELGAHRLSEIVRQVIEGTAAIHRAGLVHRDLKPANVMLRSDGRVVIVDFGLVSEQLAGGVGQTVDNRVSGTFGFIAPEVLSGGTATPASDWYSVGAILFQLLTGKLPQLLREPPEFPPAVAVNPELAALRNLCCRLLARDPSSRPTVETLLGETREWTLGPSVPSVTTSSPPDRERFVARAREIESLLQAAERVRQGRTCVCLVQGECGVGKTALLRVLAQTLKQRSALVLTARCSAWESVPYKGLDGAIDGVSRQLLKLDEERVAELIPRHVDALTRLFPALLRSPVFSNAAKRQQSRVHDDVSFKREAFAGCKDLFCRLGERYWLVVLIDDLQWADTETIPLLVELVSNRDPPNLLLVATYRKEGARPGDLLEALRSSGQVDTTEIHLGKLSLPECRELIEQHCVPPADVSAELVEGIARESGGLPFYVSELARKSLESSNESVSLTALMTARIDNLPPVDRELLELVSVAVRPITITIAELCLRDVSESLRRLIFSNLVRTVVLEEPERGFEPYAEEVRQATLRQMNEARIEELHRTLVKALESVPGTEPHWLLSHYRGGGLHHQAREYSIIAAKRALSVFAFDHAASMYLSALEYVTDRDPLWCEINVGCAEAMAKAGRGDEAAQAYVRAARATTGRKQIGLLSLAVNQWMRSGHVETGLDLLKSTLESLDIAWPKSRELALIQLLLNRARIRLRGLDCTYREEGSVPPVLLEKLDALYPAQTALGTFDHLMGAYFASQALTLALEAGEPKRLVGTLATESVYNVMLKGLDGEQRSTQAYRRLEAANRQGTGQYEKALGRVSQAMCGFWTGRWRDVQSTALQAETMLRQHVAGSSWEVSLVRSIRFTLLVQTGGAHELWKEVPNELSYAAERGDFCSQLDLMQRMVTLHLMRDEVDASSAMLKRILQLRSQHALCSLDHLIMSSAVALPLYRGQVREAQRELEERWQRCREIGVHRLPLIRLTKIGMEADCLYADSATSAGSRAARLQALVKVVRQQKIAWAEGLCYSLLGMSAELLGHSVDAIGHYESAERIYLPLGVEGPAVVARMRAARLSAASGGGAAVEEALSAFKTRGIVAPERWVRVVHSTY